ncbi:MAG: amidohydrolase family protein [Planctomycetota bacterium]
MVRIEGGRIVEVGVGLDGVVTDLGDVTLLPGLVNAHTHLELSLCEPGPAPAGGFVEWVVGLRARSKLDGTNDPLHAAQAIRRGVAESMAHGVTCVGDITRLPRLTRPTLADAPIRSVSYGEVLAPSAKAHLADAQVAAAIDDAHASDRLTVGISPHAPYSVERAGWEACMATGLPMSTHLAELTEEAEYVRGRTGPFEDLIKQLGGWANGLPTFDGSPVAFVASIGLLEKSTVLAHVNYVDDADLDRLAAGNSSVAFCPRTHAFFRHPPHRWREMLDRGINVCLGTDSRASSPDLDLRAECRLLLGQADDATLLRLATVNAADALGVDAGRIAPGAHADLIAVAGDVFDGEVVGRWVGGMSAEADKPESLPGFSLLN